MKEGTGVIIFFTIPILLIEGIVFVLSAFILQPIEHAQEAYVHIINWSNSYTPIMLVIFAVSSIFISFAIRKDMVDRIINIPAFFTGIYLVYSLILYGLSDMFSSLDGMWMIFAVIICVFWIAIVFIFILLAILGMCIPYLVGLKIQNNVSRYVVTGIVSLIVSVVMFGFSAMFATEYWQPLGNIFISIFGEH